jgi:hypothetical protein
MNSSVDQRRPDKENRYKAPENATQGAEDLMPDYMNILGMLFSMVGLNALYEN